VNSERKPWRAVGLSLLLPGLGHLYAGKPGIALTRFLIVLVAGFVATALVVTFPIGTLSLPVAVGVLMIVAVSVYADAYRTAKKTGADFEPRGYNRWYVYLGLILLSWIASDASTTVFRRLVGRSLRVISVSMAPTLLAGDWVFVSKLGRSTTLEEHGLIVVFTRPDEPDLLSISRVVGVAGDTLQMDGGTLYRNGLRIDEPYARRVGIDGNEPSAEMREWQLGYYVGKDAESYRPSPLDWGPLVVPDDAYFMMGDTRDRSYDSRFFGFVPVDGLIGRLRLVYYSYDPNHYRPLPYLTAIRWKRIGLRFG